MDSLSLSGCGKAAAFPDQDEPPAVGATANLWGRDVISLNDIDVQRLTQRALKSDFSIFSQQAGSVGNPLTEKPAAISIIFESWWAL